MRANSTHVAVFAMRNSLEKKSFFEDHAADDLQEKFEQATARPHGFFYLIKDNWICFRTMHSWTTPACVAQVTDCFKRVSLGRVRRTLTYVAVRGVYSIMNQTTNLNENSLLEVLGNDSSVEIQKHRQEMKDLDKRHDRLKQLVMVKDAQLSQLKGQLEAQLTALGMT